MRLLALSRWRAAFAAAALVGAATLVAAPGLAAGPPPAAAGGGAVTTASTSAPTRWMQSRSAFIHDSHAMQPRGSKTIAMIGSAVAPEGANAQARSQAVWQIGYHIAEKGWSFRSGACPGLCKEALDGFEHGRVDAPSHGVRPGAATGVVAVGEREVFTGLGPKNPAKQMDLVLLSGDSSDERFGHPLGLLARSIPLLKDAHGVIVGAGRWGTRAEVAIARYQPSKGTYHPMHVVAVEDSGQLAGGLRRLDRSPAVTDRARWSRFTHYAKDAGSAVDVLDSAMKREPTHTEHIAARRGLDEIAKLKPTMHTYDAKADAADAERITVSVIGEKGPKDAPMLRSIATIGEAAGSGRPARLLVPALGEDELPDDFATHLGASVKVVGVSPSGSVAAHLTNYSSQVHDVALSGVAPRGGVDELYVYPYIVKRSNVIVVRDTLRPQDDYALSTAVHDPKVVLVFANANGPAAQLYHQIEKETATTMDAAVFFGLDKMPAAAKEAAQRKAAPPESQIPKNG